ncbi:hypothetical protein LX99_04250 [Mucilaginibacter oryzae]|uniref:Uncharacterized protein n=1 Tax=Mucilaginibacter oryzae TaxID=468058 RepID=A0A316H2N7_9SPHI|nr:hypothetical protein [Mucilaginibacter oryzae]PWK72920.1 hypothetical protein LX99_04250 [Mucilaginibacter oryzae]
MNTSSNQLSFTTLTADYPAVRIPSGTAANTATLITQGASNASVLLDLLFRSLDTSNARLFDIYIGVNTTPENNIVQISVPANSGNNGVTSICSLAGLVPAIFDLDLAGNRVITLESGMQVYVVNKTALSADMYVRAKRRNF